MERVNYRSDVSIRFFTIFSIVIIGVLASASQSMSVGDYGEQCTSDRTCDLGLYCNSASLCERCGGSGEPICPGETCVEGPGWVPVPLGGDTYCIYLADDLQFRQNCGFSGYLMCPGSNTCRGASTPLQGTRFCVDCGMLGQRCCADNTCPQEVNAVCVSGRCRPPTSYDQSGNLCSNLLAQFNATYNIKEMQKILKKAQNCSWHGAGIAALQNQIAYYNKQNQRPQGTGFQGNCEPTKSGKIGDPDKLKIENDHCPDHRWIAVWVDKSQAMAHWCQTNRNGDYRQTHTCEKHCTCQGKRPTSYYEKTRVK